MEEKIERPIMTEDEFKEYIKAGSLRLFDAVRKFKSVKRAIRRGHVSPIGEVNLCKTQTTRISIMMNQYSIVSIAYHYIY